MRGEEGRSVNALHWNKIKYPDNLCLRKKHNFTILLKNGFFNTFWLTHTAPIIFFFSFFFRFCFHPLFKTRHKETTRRKNFFKPNPDISGKLSTELEEVIGRFLVWPILDDGRPFSPNVSKKRWPSVPGKTKLETLLSCRKWICKIILLHEREGRKVFFTRLRKRVQTERKCSKPFLHLLWRWLMDQLPVPRDSRNVWVHHRRWWLFALHFERKPRLSPTIH